jgi:hypothetical protein
MMLGPEGEREHVIAAGNALFTAMAGRDAKALQELLLPEAVILGVDSRQQPAQVNVRTVAAFIEAVSQSAQTLEERMWDPVVHIDGDLATLWAPYDFHYAGKFSHRGHDAFQFVRRDGRWQIAALSYTLRHA